MRPVEKASYVDGKTPNDAAIGWEASLSWPEGCALNESAPQGDSIRSNRRQDTQRSGKAIPVQYQCDRRQQTGDCRLFTKKRPALRLTIVHVKNGKETQTIWRWPAVV
jgi:hypothetical protein